jgi:OsmC subfamily peroxiredoxin
MIRKAKAIWRGTGRDGSGDLSTDSGVLASTPYSFKTRFENEKGTNPEELIAAAHAGCFTMALAFGLQSAGFTPTELSTEAAVTLEPEEPQGRPRHANLIVSLLSSDRRQAHPSTSQQAKNVLCFTAYRAFAGIEGPLARSLR